MLQIARKTTPGSKTQLEKSTYTHTVTYLPQDDAVGWINSPLISKVCFTQYVWAILSFMRWFLIPPLMVRPSLLVKPISDFGTEFGLFTFIFCGTDSFWLTYPSVVHPSFVSCHSLRNRMFLHPDDDPFPFFLDPNPFPSLPLIHICSTSFTWFFLGKKKHHTRNEQLLGNSLQKKYGFWTKSTLHEWRPSKISTTATDAKKKKLSLGGLTLTFALFPCFSPFLSWCFSVVLFIVCLVHCFVLFIMFLCWPCPSPLSYPFFRYLLMLFFSVVLCFLFCAPDILLSVSFVLFLTFSCFLSFVVFFL